MGLHFVRNQYHLPHMPALLEMKNWPVDGTKLPECGAMRVVVLQLVVRRLRRQATAAPDCNCNMGVFKLGSIRGQITGLLGICVRCQT